MDAIYAKWQGALVMGGEGTLGIRFCGKVGVTLTKVTLRSEARVFWTMEFDERQGHLLPGALREVKLSGTSEPASLTVEVLAQDERGQIYVATAPVLVRDNPERSRLRGECAAQGGTWAPRGMLGYESCDRPSRDAGKRCTSSADCEGPCIPEGEELQKRGVSVGVDGPQCGERDTVLLVGRCYERTKLFGCHARLEKVTYACKGPAARPKPTLCVD